MYYLTGQCYVFVTSLTQHTTTNYHPHSPSAINHLALSIHRLSNTSGINTKTNSIGSKKSVMGGVNNMAGGYTTIAVYGGKMSGTAYAGCHIFLPVGIYSQYIMYNLFPFHFISLPLLLISIPSIHADVHSTLPLYHKFHQSSRYVIPYHTYPSPSITITSVCGIELSFGKLFYRASG